MLTQLYYKSRAIFPAFFLGFNHNPLYLNNNSNIGFKPLARLLDQKRPGRMPFELNTIGKFRSTDLMGGLINRY